MGFFEAYFGDRYDWTLTEVHVCCPFHDDEQPSASVNTEKRLFHCQVCDVGYTEMQFIQKVLHCTTQQAQRLLNSFKASMSWEEWNNRSLTVNGTEFLKTYNIDPLTAIRDFGIKSEEHDPDMIYIPVKLFGRVIDVREYRPDSKPKVKSLTGATAGLLVGDYVLNNNKVIWICEGEKDAMVARSHGLNACCLTGGAGATPLIPEWFKDRKVAIVYDNDEAGRLGAQRLGNLLLDYAAEVRVVTAFHEGMENKEDITDYFNKYGRSRDELITCFKSTDPYVFTSIADKNRSTLHTLTLAEATRVENVNKLVRSTVQVNGVVDNVYVMPGYINVQKVAEGAGELDVGMQQDWQLSTDTLRDVLKLVAVNGDDSAQRDIYKELCRVMKTEKNVRVTTECMTNVYIANVTDIVCENPSEITVYSIGKKLESGRKYTITHKVVTSPRISGKLVSVCTEVEDANNDIRTFNTNNAHASLEAFRCLEGSVEAKVTQITEKVKGLLGYNGNNQLIQTIDFAFHTPLRFNFGRFRDVRAYLDTLVVGESRVGKSSTADVLRKKYGLGQFVSLAGNSATVPALIGGTNKIDNMNQTKAGIIPMNNEGLIIFEEFGKCAQNITAELTDIRSSNEVRINRVSGSLTMPAVVRMITLSNVKPTATGDIRPINSYPNGIAVCTELVPTAEDIARYDMVLISAYKGDSNIDPLWIPEEPFTDKEYQDRIRWVWSRSADQIVFTQEAAELIVHECNRLNEKYNCHIKIFGTEAWKKLCRLSIAVAGYIVSTDDNYNNIIVTPEVVEYASQFLEELYNNETFRLAEYVHNERKYTEVDDAGLILIGEIYFKADTLIKALDEEAEPTKTSLKAAYGDTEDNLNGVLKSLSRANMITIHGQSIMPTVKFRKTVQQLQRCDWRVDRIGQNA